MKNLKFLLTFAFASCGLNSCCVNLLAIQHESHSDVPARSELTLDRISVDGAFNRHALTPRWSPDGLHVGWMRSTPDASAGGAKSQQEIWAVSITPKDNAQTPARMLASSTQIINALRNSDAPLPPGANSDDKPAPNPFLLRDFAWSEDGASLLLFGMHAIAWLEPATGKRQTVLTGDDLISEASLSPGGQSIAFVRSHRLCRISARGGPVETIAAPAEDNILEGEPDWIYRNELKLDRAYAWSPDGSAIAWLETDDRGVASYPLRSSNGEEHRIAYPKPGGKLPIVRVYLRDLRKSQPVAIELGSTDNFYIPRIQWLPDNRHLAIERLDRRQQALDLYVADAVTGQARLLLTEKDSYWINLSKDLRFLQDGTFLWTSEHDGYRHLYHYDGQGRQITRLTHGNWEITTLDAIDEAAHRVYFTATEASPAERQLYSVHLDGSGLEQRTHRHGTHQVYFAPNAANFVDLFSDQGTPPQLSVLSAAAADSAVAKQTGSGQDLPAALPDLQPVEFLTVPLHLGEAAHAFFIKPPGFDSAKKYPVIVCLGSGPGEQLVRDAWGGETGLWMQYMASKGYLIFALDNHGASGYGHLFEEPIHDRLGAQELADQRDGINYLRSLPYVDGKRIGVAGWGYGAYLAVHLLLARPPVVQVGFADAPVIDWHLYNAVFAERYLDDPIAHLGGWLTSSAIGESGARFFKGSLLVAQGTEDESVHLENLLTLQNSFINSGKSVDTLLLPDRGHAIEDAPARKLLFTRMTDFFLKNL